MGGKTTGLARASCSTTEHIRAIDGRVLLEEASNLHAGLGQAEMAEIEVAQDALCFTAPPGLAKSRQRKDGLRRSSKQIPEEPQNNRKGGGIYGFSKELTAREYGGRPSTLKSLRHQRFIEEPPPQSTTSGWGGQPGNGRKFFAVAKINVSPYFEKHVAPSAGSLGNSPCA